MLSLRAVNRATLERQMLLGRWPESLPAAIERLLGLNAQDTRPPYISLWSRLEDFHLPALTDRLHDRTVVRTTMWRGTQHLVTADDFLAFRPLVQPVLTRAQRGVFGKRMDGVNLDELLRVARDLMGDQPITNREIRRLLHERWPDQDRSALYYSVQYLTELLHVPPCGVWGAKPAITSVAAEAWLGRPLGAGSPMEELITRYLAAYGPASVRDFHAWSGLSRQQEVFEKVRPMLLALRDHAGRELFDLPDAPRPDPATPAPVRLLPDFDNLILAYVDRTRMMTDDYRKRVCVGDWITPTLLVDGFVRGTWSISDGILTIDAFEQLSSLDRAAVVEEGARLLEFAAAEAPAHDIRFAPLS